MQCAEKVPCTSKLAQLAKILQEEIDLCTLNGANIEKLLYQHRLTLNASRHPSLSHSLSCNSTFTQPLPQSAVGMTTIAGAIYRRAPSRGKASPEEIIAAIQLLLEQTAAHFNISMSGSLLTTQSDATAATASTSERVPDPESDASVGQHHQATPYNHSFLHRSGGVKIWPRGPQTHPGLKRRRLGEPLEGREAPGGSGSSERGGEGDAEPLRNSKANSGHSQSATVQRPRQIVLDEATLSKLYYLPLHKAAVQVYLYYSTRDSNT